MQSKVIFLDFDGVLHPPSAIQGARPPLSPKEILTGWPETFQHLHILQSMLEGHTNICVVVSSSWRMFLTDKELGELLHPIKDWYCGSIGPSPQPRDKVIRSWLNEHNIQNFVVLDDQLGFFPEADKKWPTLIICKSKQGLADESVQNQLLHWINQ